jgi:hypothetical protein
MKMTPNEPFQRAADSKTDSNTEFQLGTKFTRGKISRVFFRAVTPVGDVCTKILVHNRPEEKISQVM